MKQIIMTIIIVAIANGFSAYAQDGLAMASASEGRRAATMANSSTSKGDFIAIPPGRVDERAARDFSKECKTATGITWYSCSEKGTCAFYDLNEKKGRRFYDKKGNFVYNILTYQEQSLPPAIRDLVKRTYYLDYTIDKVDEVFTDDKTVFVVNISDSRTLKTISVFDGEIFVLSDMTKSR